MSRFNYGRVVAIEVATKDGLKRFDDVVACGSYPIDIHNPAGEGTVLKFLEPGKWYEIPYRCLVPRGFKNLLIGGRCISATHETHSAIRVMPIVFAIGHAAEVAGRICVKERISVRDLDYKKLQAKLLKQGAFLREKWG